MAGPWNIDIAGQPGFGPSGAGYRATSTTNLPIATGPVTVTTQTGLAYLPGARARLSSNSAPTQWIEGIVTSYTGGSLSLNVDLTSATFGLPGVLPNYLGGLTLANDTTSPNTVLDIGAGAATSDDNSTTMLLPAFTKNCNAAWTLGSGGGALDGVGGSTLTASSWYHVWVIERVDTGVVDVLLSLQGGSGSGLTPTLPASYTKKRRIGSIRANASSQIVGFIQFGDEFLWASIVHDISSGNPGTAGVLRGLSVPTGVKVWARFMFTYQDGNASSGAYTVISEPDMADQVPASNLTTTPGTGAFTGAVVVAGGDLLMRTNISGQVRTRHTFSDGSCILDMWTKGWIDYRGK